MRSRCKVELHSYILLIPTYEPVLNNFQIFPSQTFRIELSNRPTPYRSTNELDTKALLAICDFCKAQIWRVVYLRKYAKYEV